MSNRIWISTNSNQYFNEKPTEVIPHKEYVQAASVSYLVLCATRFQNAVAALGEKAPYNNMTWFEAPIVKAPTEEIGEEAQKRWYELNQSGIALKDAIEALTADNAKRDGVVYQVEPYGEIENDPDCDQDGLSFQCDGAIVVGIKRYPVGTLSAVRREILPPELSKFLDYK